MPANVSTTTLWNTGKKLSYNTVVHSCGITNNSAKTLQTFCSSENEHVGALATRAVLLEAFSRVGMCVGIFVVSMLVSSFHFYDAPSQYSALVLDLFYRVSRMRHDAKERTTSNVF